MRPTDLLEAFLIFAGGCSNVVTIENRGNDADAFGTGSEDFFDAIEIDAADGEPRDFHVGGRPSDVIEGDWFCGWLGASGINGADGDIIGAGANGLFGLVRGVSAEADLGDRERGWLIERGNVDVSMAEEVFLAKVAEFSADLASDGKV